MIKAQRFNKQILKYLLSIGYINQKIETIYGPLNIYLDIPEKRQKVFSIFTRFKYPEKAIQNYIDCNPYSGKWNFHFSDSDECINNFVANIERIRIK